MRPLPKLRARRAQPCPQRPTPRPAPPKPQATPPEPTRVRHPRTMPGPGMCRGQARRTSRTRARHPRRMLRPGTCKPCRPRRGPRPGRALLLGRALVPGGVWVDPRRVWVLGAAVVWRLGRGRGCRLTCRLRLRLSRLCRGRRRMRCVGGRCRTPPTLARRSMRCATCSSGRRRSGVVAGWAVASSPHGRTYRCPQATRPERNRGRAVLRRVRCLPPPKAALQAQNRPLLPRRRGPERLQPLLGQAQTPRRMVLRRLLDRVRGRPHLAVRLPMVRTRSGVRGRCRTRVRVLGELVVGRGRTRVLTEVGRCLGGSRGMSGCL